MAQWEVIIDASSGMYELKASNVSSYVIVADRFTIEDGDAVFKDDGEVNVGMVTGSNIIMIRRLEEVEEEDDVALEDEKGEEDDEDGEDR